MKFLGRNILQKSVGVCLMAQLIFSFVASVSLVPTVASAATGVPQIFSFQGRLRDASGSVLGGTSGSTYYFKFSIWDNATVGSGSRLWPTAAPASTSLTVTSGLFNVRIGDTAAGYPDALTYNFQDNQDVYLQIEVSSDGASFETLGPRQRITSSGFAINAGTVLGFVPSQNASGSNIPVLSSGNLLLAGTNPQLNATNTNTLTLQGGGGTGSVQFFSSSNALTSTGTLTLSGSLSVGASTTLGGVAYTWPSSAGTNGYVLTTNGSGTLSWTSVGGSGSVSTSSALTANYFPFWSNATGGLSGTSTIYTSSGNIGIGTLAPSSSLHIVGTLRASATTTLDSSLAVDTNTLVVDADANRVGIGTTAPSSTLHVVGTFQATATSSLASATFSGAIRASSTLEVFGNTQLANVSSTNTYVAGTLNVLGNSYLANVSTTGNISLAGSVDIGRLGYLGTTRTLTLSSSGGGETSALILDRWAGDDSTGIRLQAQGTDGTAVLYVAGGTTGSIGTYSTQQLNVVTAKGVGFDAAVSGSYHGQGDIPADTYISKSLASGGNWSFYYDGSEALRLASTSVAIASSTIIGAGANAIPSSTLHVVGTLRSTATTTLATAGGMVGVGTTAPSSTLHVVGTFQVSATSTFEGTTIIDNLNLGEVTFSADSGIVSLFDMPVTSNSSAGTAIQYRTNIDGNALLTVAAESDGNGGIRNAGISVGTTTLTSLFTVASSSNVYFTIASSTGNTSVGTSTTANLFTIATTTNIMVVSSDGSIVVGAPTGGAKGPGTINAQAVYDDNTLLTDYVFDKYFTGAVIDEDKELHGDYQMKTIDEMFEYARANSHLPTIPGRAEWKQKGGFSLGALSSYLWETVETQALYIGELNDRLKKVELAGGASLQGNLSGPAQLDPASDITVKNATFAGTITVKGIATFNKDTVGQAKIKSGASTVRVNFTEPYATMPIVTITLANYEGLNGNFRYAVLNADATGFNIDISSTQASDILFNWHAFAAAPDARLVVSDGATEQLSIVVVAPTEGSSPDPAPEAPAAPASPQPTGTASPTDTLLPPADEQPQAEEQQSANEQQPDPAPADPPVVDSIVNEPAPEESAPVEETPAEPAPVDAGEPLAAP